METDEGNNLWWSLGQLVGEKLLIFICYVLDSNHYSGMDLMGGQAEITT